MLSSATAAKDQIQKRDFHERHGVLEYWLVHPTDRILLVNRLVANGYGKPDIRIAAGRSPTAAMPDLEIDWDNVFTLAEETA